MVRKKIDNRIRTLIENGVTAGHRTMFAIVGDKGRDQVILFIILYMHTINNNFLVILLILGCYIASYVVKSSCQSQTKCIMVL